ncbi:MAG: NAD(P)-dependent glycerol-3-phosphate dehydrogenase [Bacteriovoracaceae bacterium]|nr:NAD(P)-dependent glycerol-3-phosphate dehydrogenase [Bacteriovoracaceae bacterium]
MKDIGLIIGAGAFGTSIASVMAHNFKKVIIKVRSEDVYTGLRDKHENSVYLPGMSLQPNIIPALTWDEVNSLVDGKVELVVFGLPSSSISDFLYDNFDHIDQYIGSTTPVVSLSKGIDPITLELPDDLFRNYFPERMDQFAFLSGPSFAKEIVAKQITAVTLAGRSKKMLDTVSLEMLNTEYFKTFPSYDVKGVLLGGALKNVLAIAGGILEGLGYNHNTRAAMITRGIAEMLRFGKVFNARPETFYGLSGMGDLILTTTGELSRNKSFGIELAKGRSPEEIIASQRTIVEGHKTAKAVHLLSERYDIKARIFNGIFSVLYEERSPRDVISEIMTVPTKFELD